jgi:hypothetical protein
VRAFGEKVFDVIEATPDRLREVNGIGPVRAASILASWAEQKAVREIMFHTALDLQLGEGAVVADRVGETPCVFLTGLHRAERIIAERLTKLANGTLSWPWIDPDKALPWIEGRTPQSVSH